MILNTGLDAACTVTARQQGSGTSQRPRFTEWIQYAAFGTGSTTPAPTDTALDAQVGSRTLSSGGFGPDITGGVDVNTDTVWAEATFTRVFSISSNVNATEWGLAESTSGNLSVRDLFRADPTDPESSPISLTLEAGDQLQLVITLRIQAAWGYETKSFTITGTSGNDSNGTHTGEASTVAVDNAITALGCVWPGGPGTSSADNNFWAYHTSQEGKALDANLSGAATSLTPDLANYTPGDHYRDAVVTFSTSEGNGDHYAWHLGNGGSGNGYRFILTNPTHLTKASSHRLTLTVRKHISRL